jgi:hypothetical protein
MFLLTRLYLTVDVRTTDVTAEVSTEVTGKVQTNLLTNLTEVRHNALIVGVQYTKYSCNSKPFDHGGILD